MSRMLIPSIVVGLSLVLAACESENLSSTRESMDEWNQSQESPDLTGLHEGDPGYTDRTGSGAMATEDRK